MKTYKSVSEYIAKADPAVQKQLKAVRAVVKKAAPSATETIAYGMPAYMWAADKKAKPKPLFYFAGMKGHLGLYPTPRPIRTLSAQLKDYSTSKGCVRVPYSSPVPKGLIAKLIKVRMAEIRGMQ